MSLKIDMQIITNGRDDRTNFETMLLKLCMKADMHNLALLRKAFPKAVAVFESWHNSDKEIIDLDYD